MGRCPGPTLGEILSSLRSNSYERNGKAGPGSVLGAGNSYSLLSSPGGGSQPHVSREAGLPGKQRESLSKSFYRSPGTQKDRCQLSNDHAGKRVYPVDDPSSNWRTNSGRIINWINSFSSMI